MRHAAAALLLCAAIAGPACARLADLGLAIGSLKQGQANAITDVPGVLVGQITRIEGSRVRTGATAILPHGGNLFQDKVPAGVFVGNGFGKLAGSTQIVELGEIEAPILLTNTLNVAEALAASVEWTLEQPGNETVRSVNAVVGETNDGFLNDIRARTLTTADMRAAILAARGGAVAEGNVGAGTGTRLFGWKGGIGTSSRRLPGGETVGVLVQGNFGGPSLRIAGRALPTEPAGAPTAALAEAVGDGSIMIVIATDAALSDRNLARLARRAMMGVARTGSVMDNGSGDYAIAFSTHAAVRRSAARRAAVTAYPETGNEAMSGLFAAVADATEEAIANALLAAKPMQGQGGNRLEALPEALLQAR